ncbi:LytTR family DNA-binding domain-containing protein [Peptostreptococcaceae bacterium AGR-M142]
MNCIVVDDEYPSREELKYFINNFSAIKIIEEFENAKDAYEFIKENKVDIIFLDINMPKLDGMSFSKIISNLQMDYKIVFITAYKDYAVEAFEVKAFDYILKPYSKERIINTLNELENEFEKENKKYDIELDLYKNEKITLYKDDKMIVLNFNDIYYCESCDRGTTVYIKNDILKGNYKISEFVNILPQNKFIRTHKSYIVNIDKIIEIIPWFNSTYNLKIKDYEQTIPVSRNNIKKFKELMNIK